MVQVNRYLSIFITAHHELKRYPLHTDLAQYTMHLFCTKLLTFV